MSSLWGFVVSVVLIAQSAAAAPPPPVADSKKAPRQVELKTSPADPGYLLRVEQRVEGDRKKVLLEELKSLYPPPPSGI